MADDVATPQHVAEDPLVEFAEHLPISPEAERNVEESIRHDYSTTDGGIVPLDRRRPLWHFGGLWLTFQSGFSYLFAGFLLHNAGYTLLQAFGIVVLASAIYVAYGTFAAYLGSRSGQTHALLSRSIFGRVGSLLISLLLIVGPIGWVGYQANLLAQIWNGLYGWNVMYVGIALAAVMIVNNLFGFTGISAVARYAITPLMFVWISYLVIKGFTNGSDFLSATPKATDPLSFWPAVGAILGFAIWGNEPDLFRYGKPKFWWPVPAYVFGFTFGLILFCVGGWMVAQISSDADFGPAIKNTTEFSLFGATFLAWLLALAGQVAINDGNYYEAINGGQNLLGGWRRWRRTFTCLVLAGLGAFAAWLVPYHVTDGFVKLGAIQAVCLPSATIIMAADHFLVPRLFRISRPLSHVPKWEETGIMNWPGVIALVAAIAFGSYTQGIVGHTTINWYFAIVETWALALVLYLLLVWVTKVGASQIKTALGFSRPAAEMVVNDPGVPIDMATEAGH
jgi:purine-cytosine permease-like protein